MANNPVDDLIEDIRNGIVEYTPGGVGESADVRTVEQIRHGDIPAPLLPEDRGDLAHQVHIPVADGRGNVGKFVVEKEKKPYYVSAARVVEDQ
ncbi:hypothetical protein HUN08_01835 [Gordonia sp. X0973]|uniref:hypothetical protein n=1 Tax=Gordonia sp. X0973 TaxID=2742602 RepID=UPI000F52422A|nr:hypothetical protein [Gordonia sp. X0973]QKT06070.1 hypothetical protein HUN08_01835 [Gordonia sp. X0973]